MLTQNCYGRRFGRLQKCAECPSSAYCRSAADLPVGSLHSLENEPEPIDPSPAPSESFSDDPPAEPATRSYSHEELIRLIRRLLTLDDVRIRDLVRRKIEDPDISLSRIARAWGCSKTQVHKDLDNALFLMPELSVVLTNRPQYNKWRSPSDHAVFRRVRPIRGRKLTRGPRPLPPPPDLDQPELF